MVNKVLLVGNLTADPDVKATPKGTYIANLRLATNTYAGKDEAGNAKKHAEFHNLVAFGHTAEFAGQYLRKGRTLCVEGRLQTREDRIRIARDAERQFRRKVACVFSDRAPTEIYTTLSVPVMTRLRMNERTILDTLVAGGVARSRSEALAWCVRLVGMHQADWIKGLRDALVKVDEVRSKGPLN